MSETSILVNDVRDPEGPVWGSDGTLFLVEMGEGRKCLSEIDVATGTRREIAKTAFRPNGLAIDGNGRLWVAEAYEGALICFDRDGTVLKRIEGPEGAPFLWPNDIVFGPDGALYLTDSGTTEDEFIPGGAIREDFATAEYRGCVYQIDPVAGEVVRVIDRDLRFPNGIAIGPDGWLYANETITGDVLRYDLSGDARRDVFANVIRRDIPPSFRGPDGMKFGEDGRLYCTVFGQSEVTQIGPDGSIEARHGTRGTSPTNMAFALDGPYAAITEVSGNAVERMDLGCRGASLFYPTFNL